MSRRRKVLIIAYACRPGESSERQVGWYWSQLLQRNHDITVLTRETHRCHIDKWISESPNKGTFPEFVYYDLPGYLSWFKKGERGLYIYYSLWTLLAVLRCRRMNRENRWEITHFLTFGTLLWPQFGFLMNTPYILGPMGGGERIPLTLRSGFDIRGRFKVITRRVIQLLTTLNPIFWANLYRAEHIFVRTRETLEMIPNRYQGKSELLLETAIDHDKVLCEPQERSFEELRIISVGRLIESKFNPLFLEALALFKKNWGGTFRVKVIGDGPQREKLEAIRNRLQLSEVEFVGKKSAEEVFHELGESNIYFSTTMKEGGTWAFFEAIAHYLPIICLKVNGPDMIVGDGCGIKVVPSSVESARKGLAEGLEVLANDPALRRSLAIKALEHVNNNFTWDRVAAAVDKVYAECA